MKNKIAHLLTFMFLLHACDINKKSTFKDEEKLSSKTKAIVANLIEYGAITGPYIGESGTSSKQWDNFMALRKNATENELITLMEHPNPIVKCYSFNILVAKKNKNCFDLIKANLKDSTIVDHIFGCIMDEVKVNDYLIGTMFLPIQLKKENNSRYKKELDSLILFTNNLNLDYKSELLEKLKPKQQFYLRIKELALSKNYPAVVALSRFKKQEDIRTIIDLLDNKESEIQCYGLMSVENFPDQKLFENVKKIHKQEIEKTTGFNYKIVKQLYKTIVNYKNMESRKLLEQTIQYTEGFPKDFHSKDIWVALRENPDKIYDGIIEKINFSEYDLYQLEYQWRSQNSTNDILND